MADNMRVKCELGDFWSGTVVRWLQDAGTRHVSNFCPSDVHAGYPQLTHQISSEDAQDDGYRAWVRGVRQCDNCRSGLSGEPCNPIGTPRIRTTLLTITFWRPSADANL